MLGARRSGIATEESPSGATEALLVARAQRDPAAFAPLYEAYFDPILRYCYHRLGSWEAAEDAASIVFTNALTALPRFHLDERAGSFRSWLFTIAHNVVATHHRTAQRRVVRPLAEAAAVPDAAPSPEAAAEANDAVRTVRTVLLSLSPEQRQVVELRLAGLTDAEISRVLGRKPGTIRMTQFRAAQRIRALLGPQREDTTDGR